VLGSPIGSKRFLEKFLADKEAEQAEALHILQKALTDRKQAAYHILTQSHAKKFSHLARTVAPSLLKDIAASHDYNLRKTSCSIFGTPLIHWRSNSL